MASSKDALTIDGILAAFSRIREEPHYRDHMLSELEEGLANLGYRIVAVGTPPGLAGGHYDLHQHGMHVGTMNYTDGRWEVKMGARFDQSVQPQGRVRNEPPSQVYIPFCPLTTHAADSPGVNAEGTWSGGSYDTYAAAEAKAAAHGHPEAFVQIYSAD